MARVQDIVRRLPHLQTRFDPSLVDALEELDSLVDMDDAKESICLQLEYIIMKLEAKATGPLFDDHYLHTVISGPPGVGKTRLGKILAKIWMALGVIKPRPRQPTRLDTIAKYAQNAIARLDECYKSITDPRHKLFVYDQRMVLESIRKEAEVPESETRGAPFRIVTRADLVGKYVGHTAPKTQKVLESAIGGVLFIDEAYSLINGSNDTFGMEALTVLNQFMSEHADELVVIFAGYKDLLDQTIFEAQPGLRRRCSWTFTIHGYSPASLAKIFERQLAKYGWSVDASVDLVDFFTRHKDSFPNYGGDVERLAFQCKLCHYHQRFIEDYAQVDGSRKRKRVVYSIDPSKRPKQDQTISKDALEMAYKRYCDNMVAPVQYDPPHGMYM